MNWRVNSPVNLRECSGIMRDLRKGQPALFAAFGSLAQLVEQFPFKELVAGSSPARPTILQ